MVECLLNCLNEAKSQYEFKGLDFEADLVTLYAKVRKMMAAQHKKQLFGPVSAEEEGDKKLIKKGYERIKAKVKEVRQDYRKALTEGRRSGSGKVVCDNWELLKGIWGGSPATTSITNAVSSVNTNDEESGESVELETAKNDDAEVEEEDEEEPKKEEEEPKRDESEQNSVKVNPTAKFVDNKRKQMEKNLSASQRDQMFMNMAKEELKLKQNLVEGLTKATDETNKAFEKISQSMESVGKSIGEGLALLAGALSGMSQQSNIQQAQQQNYGYYDRPPYVSLESNRLNLQEQNTSEESSSNSSSFLSYQNL